jgi:hypothetical protein
MPGVFFFGYVRWVRVSVVVSHLIPQTRAPYAAHIISGNLHAEMLVGNGDMMVNLDFLRNHHEIIPIYSCGTDALYHAISVPQMG